MKCVNCALWIKLITLIAFIFIFISLIILIITPSYYLYEISIYTIYPWYFWFFIIGAIFSGQLIIFIDIFYNYFNKNKYICLWGVIAIIIPIFIVFAIPVIRGYPTYGFGDHLTHIGIIKDILSFGTFQEDVFYYL